MEFLPELIAVVVVGVVGYFLRDGHQQQKRRIDQLDEHIEELQRQAVTHSDFKELKQNMDRIEQNQASYIKREEFNGAMSNIMGSIKDLMGRMDDLFVVMLSKEDRLNERLDNLRRKD